VLLLAASAHVIPSSGQAANTVASFLDSARVLTGAGHDSADRADVTVRSGKPAKPAALVALVSRNRALVGAAVGRLIDEAAAVNEENLRTEQLHLASALAGNYLAADGVDGPAKLARAASNWSAAQWRSRAHARDIETRAARERARARSLNDAAQRNAAFGVALQLYADARKIYDALGDTHSIAVNYGSVGVTQWYRGDWQAVVKAYTAALAARRAVDDRILVGRTLNGLGSVWQKRHDYDRSASFYLKAISVRKQCGDLAGLAKSLTYLGNTYYFSGNLTSARTRYAQALAVAEQLSEPARTVDILNSVAGLDLELGHLAESSKSFRRAANVARAHAMTDAETVCRINLADTYRRTGRYGESAAQYAVAESLLVVLPDSSEQFRLLNQRGLLHMAVGNTDEARDDLLAAAKLADAIAETRYRVRARINIGLLYAELGAYNRALHAVEQARDLAIAAADGRLYSLAVGYVADMQRNLGMHDDALANYREVLAQDQADGMDGLLVEDRISVAMQLAAMGRLEKARADFRAVAGGAAHASGVVQWGWHLGIGETFEKSNPDSARVHYERALGLLETARTDARAVESTSGFFSGERRSFYEQVAAYYASLARRGDDIWGARAFRTIERARSRRLAERMTPGGNQSANNIASIRALQRALPRGALVLSYMLGDSTSLLWAIGRKGADLFALPPRARLAPEVQTLRDAMGAPGRADKVLIGSLRGLYGALVAPAATRMAKAKQLIILPDGFLFAVPFEALLMSDQGDTWRRRDYLGQRYETLYAPSASVYLQLAARDRRAVHYKTELVAFGDPDTRTAADSSGAHESAARGAAVTRRLRLAPLPHAAEEVEAIANTVHGKTDVRTGTDASEAALRTAVRTKLPRIVHLAAHGLIDPSEPDASSIALAGGMGDGPSCDGLLRAREIAGMNLSAALVVFSACESGSGRVTRGEGVVGLTQACLEGGAGGVVASLWAVSDESTAQLMEAFYHAMMGKRRGAARAMKKARTKLIEGGRFSHPFYWAPFVVIGAGGVPW